MFWLKLSSDRESTLRVSLKKIFYQNYILLKTFESYHDSCSIFFRTIALFSPAHQFFLRANLLLAEIATQATKPKNLTDLHARNVWALRNVTGNSVRSRISTLASINMVGTTLEAGACSCNYNLTHDLANHENIWNFVE